MATLDINGRAHELRAADDTPLLWALRDELHLTGAKYGCGKALCGACTVLVDGQPQRACVLPVSALEGRAVTTIEGVDTLVSRAVMDAWNALEVAQCGYCQPGQVMAATALLSRTPRPSDADIDQAMRGNLCRCATYVRIRAAIHRAAEALA
ncbi:MAG: (2Fe-2S)-binding protein [Gammaproteobacteria bacterium]